MKSLLTAALPTGAVALAVLLAVPFAGSAAPNPDFSSPAILGIRQEGTNVLVTVSAPSNFRRITLESRPRLGTGNWVARELAWPDGAAGEYTFTLPASRELEMIRIKGEDTDLLPLPAAFYQGRSLFLGNAVASAGIRGGGLEDSGGVVALPGSPAPTVPTDNLGAGGTTRPVVESDIWQLDGNTLYYFNQFRGLQVLDVTNPDAPVLRGQFPLASVGEQMYLLPGGATEHTRYVALLTREGCGWDRGAVVLVRLEDGVPTRSQHLPLTAIAKESRLVGDALYAATQGWRSRTVPAGLDDRGILIPEQAFFENVTTVEAYDLANPEAPQYRGSLEIAASPNAISATDRFLFVAVSGNQPPLAGQLIPIWARAGTQSVVVFDISDPHGHFTQLSSLPTAGFVGDKFKLNLRDDVLTVVSQKPGTWDYVWQPNPAGGSDQVDWTRTRWVPPVALLETFSLANPTDPARLGHLSIITNESVYATRFDGDRAYVVTFRQTDPLWIIDLSNPSQPAIRGELHVPGWSTYIHPLGDRLIAMGQETWSQPSVSLYDVSDVTTPRLLQRVFLGQWAWSEASQDEKAFKVFPEDGLVLLPWAGQRDGTATGSGSYFQGIQLLDFTRDTLTKRGVIEHQLAARRATLTRNRILSISGTELISADATDRDHPVVKATLDLAPIIDRVFVRGDRLVEIALPLVSRPLEVRLASAAAPDQALARLHVPGSSLVGAELRDRWLYLLQKDEDTYRNEERLVTNEVVVRVDLPSRISYITNDFIEWIPQPPRVTGSNWVEVVGQLPPLPDDPTPRYVTNRFWRPILVEQPPLPQTNQIVSRVETIPPPQFVTNSVLSTNIVSIRLPGAGWLRVVDVDASPNPVLVGETKFAFDESYWGSLLEPTWPTDNTLVWVPPGDLQLNYGWRPWLDIAFPLAPTDTAMSIAACLDCGIFPYPWWGESTAPELLGFDVAQPDQPRLTSRVRPGGDTKGWNGSSPVQALDGKLFLSHSQITYLPPPQPYLTVTNADGSTWQQWQPGTYERTHFLDVIDYRDPLQPAVRPPASFPGRLAGSSHQGSLLYALTEAGAGSALAGLAYDGEKAFLVDSIPLPAQWPQPVLVLPQGTLLIGRASTNTEPSAVESWALAQDGRFARFGSVGVPEAIRELHAFGRLVAGPTVAGNIQLLDAQDTFNLRPASAQSVDCSYWFNLEYAAGSWEGGLWVPRGYYGLWHLKPSTQP